MIQDEIRLLVVRGEQLKADTYNLPEFPLLRELHAFVDNVRTFEEHLLKSQVIMATKALHDLTPGGSEFVEDIDKCVGWIRAQRIAQQERLVRFVKEQLEVEKQHQAQVQRLISERDSFALKYDRALRERKERENWFVNELRGLQQKVRSIFA